MKVTQVDSCPGMTDVRVAICQGNICPGNQPKGKKSDTDIWRMVTILRTHSQIKWDISGLYLKKMKNCLYFVDINIFHG